MKCENVLKIFTEELIEHILLWTIQVLAILQKETLWDPLLVQRAPLIEMKFKISLKSQEYSEERKIA